MNEKQAELILDEIFEDIDDISCNYDVVIGQDIKNYAERSYDDKGTFIRIGINLYYTEDDEDE